MWNNMHRGKEKADMRGEKCYVNERKDCRK